MHDGPSRLLVIGHDPSPNLQRLCEAVVSGARDDSIERVEVRFVRPLDAVADDVLDSQAVILVTPENLGYMAGALKDFFDRCFYELLERTDALPCAVLIRAGKDGTGTRRAIESICGGLNWKRVQAPVICRGEWDESFVRSARELGMTLAAGLEAGVF
ncbi:flavodoxin family protein [Halomonas denitrificans]|nr:NAD(P)H-dependent oxidoreductase [Halomonas denitrificans]